MAALLRNVQARAGTQCFFVDQLVGGSSLLPLLFAQCILLERVFFKWQRIIMSISHVFSSVGSIFLHLKISRESISRATRIFRTLLRDGVLGWTLVDHYAILLWKRGLMLVSMVEPQCFRDNCVDAVDHDEVPNVIGNYHICVPKHCRMDANLIAKAGQMKLFVQFGVGLEGVDIAAATQHNIKVARIPGIATGNAASCAEMAIYLMLGLLRKQKEMEISIQKKNLGIPVGETLLGKTVFILGLGAIGVNLAKRLRPFGVKIIATKRRWSSNLELPIASNGHNDEFDKLVDRKGGPEDIYEFAAEADIVVACLIMNSETAGIVDEKFLSCMRKGSLLINIARGGILDYEAVLHHLQSGHLGGLAIDVAWTEPFNPDDPILKFPNVLITPHVAGITEHCYRKMAKK